jgi:hypothetical protein
VSTLGAHRVFHKVSQAVRDSHHVVAIDISNAFDSQPYVGPGLVGNVSQLVHVVCSAHPSSRRYVVDTPARTFVGSELLRFLGLGVYGTGPHLLGSPGARVEFAAKARNLKLILLHGGVGSVDPTTARSGLDAISHDQSPAVGCQFDAAATYTLSPFVVQIRPTADHKHSGL